MRIEELCGLTRGIWDIISTVFFLTVVTIVAFIVIMVIVKCIKIVFSAIAIIIKYVFIRKKMCVQFALNTCEAIIYNDNITTYSILIEPLLREVEEIKEVFVLDRYLNVQKIPIQDLDSLDREALESLYSSDEILRILEMIDKENYKKVVVFSNIEITEDYVNTVRNFRNIKQIVVFSPKGSYQKSFSNRFCKNARTVIYYI